MYRKKILQDAIALAAAEDIAPEEGHFMTAAVVNRGLMTQQEHVWLQQDLAAIELDVEEPDYEPQDDWEDLYRLDCPHCGGDLNFCPCVDEPGQEKYLAVVATCPINDNWYDFNLSTPASQVEFYTHQFIQSHATQCGCGGEPEISAQEL